MGGQATRLAKRVPQRSLRRSRSTRRSRRSTCTVRCARHARGVLRRAWRRQRCARSRGRGATWWAPGNEIGEAGAAAIGDALKVNKTVTTIDLEGTCMRRAASVCVLVFTGACTGCSRQRVLVWAVVCFCVFICPSPKLFCPGCSWHPWLGCRARKPVPDSACAISSPYARPLHQRARRRDRRGRRCCVVGQPLPAMGSRARVRIAWRRVSV